MSTHNRNERDRRGSSLAFKLGLATPKRHRSSLNEVSRIAYLAAHFVVIFNY